MLTSFAAHAQVFDSGGPDYDPPEPERRYGFTFGAAATWGYGSFVGYPNKLGQIDDPAFEQTVGGFSQASSLWLGGTLRDWFTFGFGLSARSAEDGENTAQNGAFVLHIEAFPLYGLGGEWRDVGAFTEVGAGGSLILQDDDDVADGGAMSVIGIGAFYEPWQLWHFSFGPVLAYTHEFSQSMTSHVVSLGIRSVFYGVQP